MTANRRIFLNIVATYGRSLYALAIGLFCGRWTLMALGQVDYGLVGVIGGLIGFLGFLNSIMSGSIGRFFAVSIGEESANPNLGLEKCRRWFTAAAVVSALWPTIVVMVGYPIGHWAVLHYLNIPPDRVASCVWVWRFVCISFWVSMVAIPLNAMYGAKQFIAELTIYSFITSTLNVCFVYYMITHPSDWLARYSFWTCLLSVVPTTIIAIRAVYIFPECRIVREYLHCWDAVKQMLIFSWWTMICGVGALFANQGCMIMINKNFGPAANAGVNIGTTLSGHTETLGGSLIGAFSPAIMNAYGSGDYKTMECLIYRVSKIGVLCMLIFAIPLSLEVDEVLLLWLKTPPAYATGCCLLAMLHGVIDKMSIGHLIAINAKGDIAKFQICAGSAWLFVLPFAYFFMLMGGGVYSALLALIIARSYVIFARVWFARRLLSLKARDWIRKVFVPVSMLTFVSYCFGWMVTLVMNQSFIRIVATTFAVETFLIPAAWFLVLDDEERSFLSARMKRMIYHV